MMKISVSSYSYSQYTSAGRLTQFDLIQKAKDMGFDAIEFLGIEPHDGSSVVEYAAKLRRECERLDMPVSNYTFGCDFLNCANMDEEIARVKGQIDIAEILGAVSVRHDATIGYRTGRYRGFDTVLPILADACRKVTEYAAAKGIRTMVENHGFFVQDSIRVEKLVQAVNHPNFGLLVDMGNFACVDEVPYEAVSRVAPFAFYVHAKDFHIKSPMMPNPGAGFFQSRSGMYLRGAIIGHGDIPVRHCLTALKKSGYDGYVGIEFEGMEDCITGLQVGLSNLRRYINEC